MEEQVLSAQTEARAIAIQAEARTLAEKARKEAVKATRGESGKATERATRVAPTQRQSGGTTTDLTTAATWGGSHNGDPLGKDGCPSHTTQPVERLPAGPADDNDKNIDTTGATK